MSEKKEDDDTGKVVAGGCILLLLSGVIWAFITVMNFLSSCGELPPPTAQELAQMEREDEERRRKEAAFQAEQSTLWALPATALTQASLATELAKCRKQIQEEDGSPYAWVFDPVDMKRALNSAQSYGLVTITSMNRKDAPIENNVEWARYTCHFKGAGHEAFSKSYDTRYTSSYSAL